MKNTDVLRSVLCVTVSESTQLHAKLGSRETLRAVERCLKRVERAVEAFGGRVIKITGDQLLAVFELADRASQASGEMQQRVADLPPVSGVKLALRVGFAHGPVSDENADTSGEAVDAAVRLAGLARPGQVLINVQTYAALSLALKNMTRDPGLAGARERSPGTQIFELVAPDSSSDSSNTDAPNPSRNDGLLDKRLLLRYSGQAILLDKRTPLIRLGREDKCDVLIHGHHVSRNHARIERRGDSFVLADTSANGTYVTLNGGSEAFLHGQECVLYGRGVLSFAAPASSPDADCAEFELL